MKGHEIARLVRQLDLVLLVLAAPIALLVGAPVVGYGIGMGAWALVRGLGVAVDRRAEAIAHVSEEVALRVSHRLLRVGVLAGATLLALGAGGRADGLTALSVMALAYTVRLSLSVGLA